MCMWTFRSVWSVWKCWGVGLVAGRIYREQPFTLPTCYIVLPDVHSKRILPRYTVIVYPFVATEWYPDPVQKRKGLNFHYFFFCLYITSLKLEKSAVLLLEVMSKVITYKWRNCSQDWIIVGLTSGKWSPGALVRERQCGSFYMVCEGRHVCFYY